MRILFVYRNPDMGFSIGKVFKPIENEMKKYCEVDSVYLPVANYSLTGLWHNIKAAKKAISTKQYDVVHITAAEHYLLPFLKNSKTVIAVHDLGSIIEVKNPLKRFLKSIFFIHRLSFADKITFISESSLSEALN